MKYVWEEKDIIGGRFVCKPHEVPTKGKKEWEPDGWTAKWTFKIGYTVNPSGMTTISVVDGSTTKACTKAVMAERLNRDGLIPMPYSWLIKTMEYLHRDGRYTSELRGGA